MSLGWDGSSVRCQMKNDALEQDDDSLNFATGVFRQCCLTNQHRRQPAPEFETEISTTCFLSTAPTHHLSDYGAAGNTQFPDHNINILD